MIWHSLCGKVGNKKANYSFTESSVLMPIYEIGQFIGANMDADQVVAFAFARLRNREIHSIEALLMAIYAIDTYGSETDKATLSEILEVSPLEEEVLEYRLAA